MSHVSIIGAGSMGQAIATIVTKGGNTVEVFNSNDADKPVTMSGTVTRIEWTNPHCYFYIDVKNEESGQIDNWALELGNPNALLRAGWTPNSLKIGDAVAVEGTRAKDGTLLGNARSMVLMSTGRRLFTGSSQTTNP